MNLLQKIYSANNDSKSFCACKITLQEFLDFPQRCRVPASRRNQIIESTDIKMYEKNETRQGEKKSSMKKGARKRTQRVADVP